MSSIITEIREKADLVTIISEYVPLKKRGRNFLGLCPFHQEKTASFTVSPEKQIWHCFGCSKGGNIFDFIMKIEKIDFAEALEILAGRLGLAIDRTKIAASKKNAEVSKKLARLLSEAAEYFHQLLFSAWGKEALNYLDKRELSQETIRHFYLGLALASGRELFQEFTRRGYSPAALAEAGLVIRAETGADYYDRFRGRIIFPVFDVRGRVIAFGGRVFQEGQEPKYLNSPETAVYIKGEHLYGLNWAKEKIKELDEVIVVEGYLDVISLHQADFKNTIAALGTAFTPAQAKLLARFSKNVFVAFDLDEAGLTASLRGIEILTDLGLKPKVINFGGFKDPDELIKAQGPLGFKEVKDQAQTWLEFMINQLIGRYDLKIIEGRAEAAAAVADFLSRVGDPVLQTEYAKYAAKKIGLEENLIISQIQQKKYEQQKAAPRWRVPVKNAFSLKPFSKEIQAQRILLRIALENKKLAEQLKQLINPGFFKDEKIKKLAAALWEKPEELEIFEFIESQTADREELKNLVTALLMEIDFLVDEEKTFYDCLALLEKTCLEDKKSDILAQIGAAEREGSFEKAKELKKTYCLELQKGLAGGKENARI